MAYGYDYQYAHEGEHHKKGKLHVMNKTDGGFMICGISGYGNRFKRGDGALVNKDDVIPDGWDYMIKCAGCWK